jgi:hypothetical protein
MAERGVWQAAVYIANRTEGFPHQNIHTSGEINHNVATVYVLAPRPAELPQLPEPQDS